MISATCSPASRSVASRSSARRGGGLAHHPEIGVETPLQVTGQHLDRGRVLIDDEKDRLGDRLAHGSTSRRRRKRRPSPDGAMRWQNNCQTSLRRRLPRSMTGPATLYAADKHVLAPAPVAVVLVNQILLYSLRQA
jgi:hypothetical protein